jgi:hypothetical protein
MSWNVSYSGDAKHAAPEIERQVNAAKHGRNGFEQTAMGAVPELVERLSKHAALTPYQVSVSASGHHAEDGTGSVSISFGVYQPVTAQPVTAAAPEATE